MSNNHKGTVILVDDDPNILGSLSQKLRDQFTVLEADGYQKCMNILMKLHQRGGTFDLIVTDLYMGTLRLKEGVKLMAELHKLLDPEVSKSKKYWDILLLQIQGLMRRGFDNFREWKAVEDFSSRIFLYSWYLDMERFIDFAFQESDVELTLLEKRRLKGLGKTINNIAERVKSLGVTEDRIITKFPSFLSLLKLDIDLYKEASKRLSNEMLAGSIPDLSDIKEEFLQVNMDRLRVLYREVGIEDSTETERNSYDISEKILVEKIRKTYEVLSSGLD